MKKNLVIIIISFLVNSFLVSSDSYNKEIGIVLGVLGGVAGLTWIFQRNKNISKEEVNKSIEEVNIDNNEKFNENELKDLKKDNFEKNPEDREIVDFSVHSKENYGELLKYKGDLFGLIEDVNKYYWGERIETKEYEKFKSIFPQKKLYPYSVESYWDCEKAGNVDNFLEDVITNLCKTKLIDMENKSLMRNQIGYIKEFFFGNSFSWSNALDKKMKGLFSSYIGKEEKHNYLLKIFSNSNSSDPLLEKIMIKKNDNFVSQFSSGDKIGQYYSYDGVLKLTDEIIPVGKQFEEIVKEVEETFKINSFLKNIQYNPRLPMPMNIFYGDPGVGKTLLLEQIFLELIKNKFFKKDSSVFILLSVSDIIRSYVGQTERMITKFFQEIITVGKEVKEKDGIVFVCMNEIDSLCPNREKGDIKEYDIKMVNTFLNEIDNLKTYNLPIAMYGTTNSENRIDPAMARSGRLKLKKINKPDSEEKMQITEYYETKYCDKKFINLLSKKEKEDLVARLHTGAEICEAVQSLFREKLFKLLSQNSNDIDKLPKNKEGFFILSEEQ